MAAKLQVYLQTTDEGMAVVLCDIVNGRVEMNPELTSQLQGFFEATADEIEADPEVLDLCVDEIITADEPAPASA